MLRRKNILEMWNLLLYSCSSKSKIFFWRIKKLWIFAIYIDYYCYLFVLLNDDCEIKYHVYWFNFAPCGFFQLTVLHILYFCSFSILVLFHGPNHQEE